MTGPVVVALDARDPAPEAEALGRVLAAATDAPLILATVFPLIDARSRIDTRHYERALSREAEAFLAERAAGLSGDVGTRAVGSFSAAHGLHLLAREVSAQLVVLGPSRRRPGRGLPGPMGSRFAHGAPCPVAVAPPGYGGGALRRIGVAYVPAPDGDAALTAAASLAARTGASLQAIAVEAPLPWLDLTEPQFDGVGLQSAYHGHLAAALDDAVAALPGHPRAEQRLLAGEPAEVLTSAADDLDLLVCGSRRHGPFGLVLLGSVSRELLERSSCPVLIVPRAAD